MTGHPTLILLEPRPRAHPLGWLLSAGAAGAVLSALAAMALAAQRPADSAGDQPETPVIIMLAPSPPAPAPEPLAAPAPPAEADPPAEPDQPETAEAMPDPAPPEPAPEPAPPDPVLPQPPTAAPPEALAIRPAPRPTRRAEPAAPRQPAARTPTRAATGPHEQAEPAKAPAAASPRKEGAVSSGAGSRAEADYRARVLGRIRRTPKRPTPDPGVAVVSFAVGASGQLAEVRILRSSGSAALDRIALDHIRRAAPFPAPPDGATRDFTLNFLGK